ncbi:hypothetical protein B0J14DRAFT_587719, partial [Halenospora varia]
FAAQFTVLNSLLILSTILNYVIADAQPLPLGGGVRAHRAHHPIASVSHSLRSIYLDHPYPISAEDNATAPVRLHIGEALEFSDLITLAAFFQGGLDATTLHKVRFLSISYPDNHTATGWGRRTVEYAYEAFEILYKHWDLMQISWLRLCLPYSHAISSVDDPGVWSLSKIHNLPHLTVLGPYGCIAPQVRKLLKACTRRKKFLSRRLLGVENPGARDVLLQQYEEFDNRYKYLHDRQTVTARRIKQRAAYHKRRRRFPMLSKRRKRRCV